MLRPVVLGTKSPPSQTSLSSTVRVGKTVRGPKGPQKRAVLGIICSALLLARVAYRSKRVQLLTARRGSSSNELASEDKSAWRRFTTWWSSKSKIDGKSLRKMGLMCLLSYGFVSNINAMLLIAASTYLAILRTGLSPFASPEALKQFGIAWVGLYVFSNIIRPVRIGLALSLSPVFENAVKQIQDKFGCKRWIAIAITVFLANVVGTFAFLFLSFSLVTLATGVPVSILKLGTLVKAGKAARASASVA